MAKPDALRTDEDKILEDKLISRLMAIVSQRNEIVDCLEMDRLRELEEDESIEIHLGEYAAIKPQDEEEMLKKKKDKKKKEKKKKIRLMTPIKISIPVSFLQQVPAFLVLQGQVQKNHR